MLAEEQPEKSFSSGQLVERIQSGDVDAETDLVNKYWQTLYFIINRRASDPELAADITQETLAIVISKARSGQIENSLALASFIRQTGINLLIASFRKETRQKTDACEHIDLQVAHNQLDLSELINQQQLINAVEQILEELSTQRDRDLLLRYFVYGQSKQIICLELALSDAHFDRVLYRARHRLRQTLKIKFNIDTEKLSLSSILMVLLVVLSPENGHCIEISFREVGEITAKQHYAGETFMDRSDSPLDSVQYQNETRSS